MAINGENSINPEMTAFVNGGIFTYGTHALHFQ